jgi:hypothetical protein
MVSKLSGWFKIPVSDNIEQTQKAQFLYVTLLVTIGASLLIGIQNIQEDTYIGIALFGLAAICFLCIPLSNRGYYVPVAAFISLLVLTMITLSILAGLPRPDHLHFVPVQQGDNHHLDHPVAGFDRAGLLPGAHR